MQVLSFCDIMGAGSGYLTDSQPSVFGQNLPKVPCVAKIITIYIIMS